MCRLIALQVLVAFLLCLDGSGGAAEPLAKAQDKAKATVEKMDFGKTADGTAVDLYLLTNTKGMKAKIITYGGIITELHVPDRAGKFEDVVLGFDELKSYLAGHPFFGCITGRYANRIAKGKFTLDGKEYTLATNNGPNHLHGGKKGFDKYVWKAESFEAADGVGVKLSHRSPDGDEGYPGNLSVIVTYTLTNQNELKIDYTATTDKATPVNLTNHSYFNLAGAKSTENILGHELILAAEKYTPTDDELIPTGEIKSVQSTPLDFTKPAAIGARIKEIKATPVGYDHNFVLAGGAGKGPHFAAKVLEPKSGRILEVLTTEPGVQLYTGNFLDGKVKGKGGVAYSQYHGFCLETQHFPDSVNKPNFPSVILKPGETYRTTTIYKFSVKE